MWIKVCGIRSVEDAVTAITAGVDAIGLNFYADSPRGVTPETAAAIVREVGDVDCVGVFVNHSVPAMQSIVEQCQLTVIQIHGDETVEDLAEIQAAFPGIRLIRAFRVGDEGLSPMVAELETAEARGVAIWRTLVDARVRGAYGGTGATAPWALLKDYPSERLPPLILAGGLKPDNVSEAVRTVHPWGVDVAGGVESAPGVKSREAMMSFVERSHGEVA